MIAYLDGKLAYKDPSYVIIDVGGVGYQVKISLQTYAALHNTGERCKLHTLLIIREDAHTLFGFHDAEEKVLFEDLTSVSGIGPSIALVMLSSLSSAEIKQALVTEDVKTIQSIKGIGLKTAQRAIIELKDKLKKDNLASGVTPSSFTPANAVLRNESLAALVMLGIPRAAAEKSIDAILKREGNDISVEQLIKLALR
ncbi:Holliday junction ATP-dependent DNA helicase RuvA [Emticicia aquatica]|uniref:Holliday junction branch migration complex subunit RuvA n=1 Tax=Emticicia aquatica TaxID=1681835 RepID=A0ABM9ANP8_9BACT|nr:Holliday junction branch migration protein RuvA [Emticicia aquatica]CAH0995258.1 Holliday junction ATP-dependent DNA helicase RuvA [Emticicia aquatica]